MMMKIHRVVPALSRLIDLAKAGVAIRAINPAINPTLTRIILFFIFNSSFVLFSTLKIAFVMPRKYECIYVFDIIWFFKNLPNVFGEILGRNEYI